MSDGESRHVVFAERDGIPGPHLLDCYRKLYPIYPQVDGSLKDLIRAWRSVDLQRFLSALQRQGPEEADDSQEMVGMKVSDENGLYSEARPVPHHLPLSTLSAVEEHQITLSLNRDPTDIPAYRGPGGGGAEEGDSNHGVSGVSRRGLKTVLHGKVALPSQ